MEGRCGWPDAGPDWGRSRRRPRCWLPRPSPTPCSEPGRSVREGPDGPMTSELTVTEADGGYAGTLSGERGSTDPHSIVIDGASFSFVVTFETLLVDIDLSYSGTVSGNTLTGTVGNAKGRTPRSGVCARVVAPGADTAPSFHAGAGGGCPPRRLRGIRHAGRRSRAARPGVALSGPPDRFPGGGARCRAARDHGRSHRGRRHGPLSLARRGARTDPPSAPPPHADAGGSVSAPS